MNFIKAKRIIESAGMKLIKESESEPYWIIEYDDGDSEDSYEVPYSEAKTAADAYCEMLKGTWGFEDDGLFEEFGSGYDSLDELKSAIEACIAGRDPGPNGEPSCMEYFIDARLVKNV